MGSSCWALVPALASESNTKVMRATMIALSRFCDGDRTAGGGCFPWKPHVRRCSPTPAGPFRVRTVSPRTSVMTIFVCARRSVLPVVRRYTISAPYAGLGARNHCWPAEKVPRVGSPYS